MNIRKIWVISIFFLFISGVGAYDYIMTLSQNAEYFDSLGYGPSQIAYFTNYPLPLTFLWTFAVWGMVAGALLLPFQPRWSAYALLSSAIGQILLGFVTFTLRNRWEVIGARLSIQDLVVMLLTVIAALLIWRYSTTRKQFRRR